MTLRSLPVGEPYVTSKHSTPSAIVLSIMALIHTQGIKDRELRGRLVECTAFSHCRLPLYSSFILKAIGFVYVAKAKHHLATRQTFLGVGGWLHNVQGKYHVFSETYVSQPPTEPSALTFLVKGLNRTVRHGIKGRFRPNPGRGKRRKPQPRGKTQTRRTSCRERTTGPVQGRSRSFSPLEVSSISTPQGAKLEIESVLRETCDKVLEDPSITPAKANLRAVALQILGEAYMSARKEDEDRKEESEYVKIDTKGPARSSPQDRR